jgi:predicted ATPase
LIYGEESLLYQAHKTPALRDRPQVVKSGHRETALREPEYAQNPTVKFFRAALSRFRFHQFHDTSDESRLRGAVDKDDNAWLYANAGNLAAILLRLQEAAPAQYQRIVETIRMAAPFFDDFVLTTDVAGSRYITLRWRAKGRGEYVFGPHQLSDGTLRFMALCTLLLQPPSWRPALIVLDEPELGLHPFALELLAGLLAEASTETHIIVSTQSSTFIDAFAPEDIIVAQIQEEASHFRRLDADELGQWLSDYSLSELVRKNVIEAGPQP